MGRVEIRDLAVFIAVAGNDVEMQVHDRLFSLRVAVIQDVAAGGLKSRSDLAGQAPGELNDLGQGLFIALQNVGNVLLGHDQSMAAGELGNVQNSQDIIVFIYLLAGNFTLNDIAEYTHKITPFY